MVVCTHVCVCVCVCMYPSSRVCVCVPVCTCTCVCVYPCVRVAGAGSSSPVDPAMIGILVGLAVMFVIICVVLRLFSKWVWGVGWCGAWGVMWSDVGGVGWSGVWGVERGWGVVWSGAR